MSTKLKSYVPTWRLFNRWLKPIYNKREQDKEHDSFIIPTYVEAPDITTIYRNRILQPYKIFMGGSTSSFQMFLVQNSSTVQKNTNISILVNFQLEENFTGNIHLALRNSPANLTLLTTGVHIPEPVSETQRNIEIFVGNLIPGTYTFTLEGEANNVIRTVEYTLIVVDPTFDIVLNPSINYIYYDTSITSTFTLIITPKNNFTGTLNFEIESFNGINAHLSRTDVNVENSNVLNVPMTLTFNTDLNVNTYILNLKVSNTNFNIVKTVTHTIILSTFNVQIVPSEVTTQINTINNPILTIIPINRFEGNVNIRLSRPISGIQFTPITTHVSISPLPITLNILATMELINEITINVPIQVISRNIVKEVNYQMNLQAIGFNIRRMSTQEIRTRANSVVNEELIVEPYGGFLGRVHIRLKEPIPSGISIGSNLFVDITSTVFVRITVPIIIDSNVSTGSYTLILAAYDNSENISTLIQLGIRVL